MKTLKSRELIKAESELLLIKREVELSNADSTLESIFYTHSKAHMIGAKFYHECMLLKIPCILEVTTQFGRVDAIIELNDKFLIIEFKTTERELYETHTAEQLARYCQHNCPVILIHNENCLIRFLLKLKNIKLTNSLYFYHKEKFQVIHLSTESVDRIKEREC